MTDTTTCRGSGGPAGEPFPGLLPLRECPTCSGMFHPTRDGKMTKHRPASEADLISLRRTKANLLFIVFARGDNWARIAPVVHLDHAAARKDAAARDGEVTGVPRSVATAYARPA